MLQAARAHGLRAQGPPGRDPRPGDRVLHFRTGQGLAAPLRDHLKKLASHSALYGSADVVSQIVNLLLTPLYTAFLQPADYGALAVLFLWSAVAKIAFRLGLDAGFFRVYYDQKTGDERAGLTFTVACFAAAAGTALFGIVFLVRAPLAGFLLGDASAANVRLTLLATADIYLGTFAFVPLALLRIRNRAGLFATLIAGRNLVNTVLKVVLVVEGRGVLGVLWSDVIATGVLSLALAPTLIAGSRAVFQPDRLREVLGFGLPKAPHGLMIQLLNLADRKILASFRDLATVGVYDKGYVLGAGVKFALSAFEPAWQPFVYDQLGKPDAAATLARLVTIVWTAFVTFGLPVAIFGRELLMALTFKNPAFWAGAPVVPVVVLAYLFHGAFLLTSIGIGISKDTRYYPIITVTAAAVNLSANFALIPRFGMMGAAWATTVSYAVMAGLGYLFSRRLYPIPFEAGRLARVSGAALLAFALSRLSAGGLATTLAIQSVALAVYPATLWLSGFLRDDERAFIRERLRRR